MRPSLTMEAMIKLTPQSVMDRRTKCSVSMKETILRNDADGDYKHCLGIVKSDSVPRNVEIKFYSPELKDHVKCPVFVWCSCEYFTYTCETANARVKTSKVILSNGAAPREKNPDERPHLCKHLVAFAKIAIKATPSNLKQMEEKLRKEREKRDKEKISKDLKKPAMPKPSMGIKPITLPKPVAGIKPMPGIGTVQTTKK